MISLILFSEIMGCKDNRRFCQLIFNGTIASKNHLTFNANKISYVIVTQTMDAGLLRYGIEHSRMNEYVAN